MKKPFRGGKTGFLARNLCNSTLLFLLVFSYPANPQIPLNGFCNYKSFQSDKGGSILQTLNYNGDAYSDKVIYHPGKKSISVYAGLREGGFQRAREQKISVSLSAIVPVRDNFGRIKSYGLVSRPQRKILVGQFSSTGFFTAAHSVIIDGYPESVSSADLDNDTKPELIISGTSVPGIQIINPEKEKNAKVIEERKPFPLNVVFDIDLDGFPDLAAYSLWDNKIQIFYNDFRGGLKAVRGVDVVAPVTNLTVFDLNLDGFQDILYSSGNSIRILYGDSVASYNTKGAINTRHKVDKFVVGDYNRDGAIDVAYLNTTASVVNVIFFDNSGQSHPELEYISAPGLADIASFYSKFITGISALSAEGYIYTVTKMLLFNDGDKITFGGEAHDIAFSDLNRDGINDFLVADTVRNNLKLILRDRAGYPVGMHLITAKNGFNRYRFSVEKEDKINFILYHSNSSLFEFFSLSLKGNKAVMRGINGYTAGNIRAASFPLKTDVGYNFSFSSVSRGRTYVETFVYDNNTLTGMKTAATDSLFEVLDFITYDSLYYWIRRGNELGHAVSTVNKFPQRDPGRWNIIKNGEGKFLSSREVSGFGLNESANLSVLRSGGKINVVLLRKNKFRVFRDDLLNGISDEDLMKTAYFDLRREGVMRPVFFDSRGGRVYSTGFLMNRGRLLLSKIAEIPGAERFYPVTLYPNKNFILYNVKDERYISLIRI